MEGTLSSFKNSTTTPLPISGTYIGEWEQNEYPDVGSDGRTPVSLGFDIRPLGKVWRTIRPLQITTSSVPPAEEFILLEPLTDVRARIRDVSDNDTAISCIVQYELIDE